MEDICMWFEVLRSLLPQRYEMRMVWEREAIFVADPNRGSAVWLSAGTLANRTPSEVVESTAAALRVSPVLHYARVA
jgi:hypothetical protein